jgi:hypothetical protein
MVKVGKAQIDYVNENTEDEMRIEGYQESWLYSKLAWLLIPATLGVMWFIFYWKPEWKLKFTHNRCDIKKANKVLLIDKYQQAFVERVDTLSNYSKKELFQLSFSDDADENDLDMNNNKIDLNEDKKSVENQKLINNFKKKKEIKYFINKRIKYLWSDKQLKYIKLVGLESNMPLSSFCRLKGLSEEEHTLKSLLYGKNLININLTPIFKLFIREILSPFYIFQIFSCILFFVDDYLTFAVCIILTSTVSITYSLYLIRKSERSLRKMIHNVNKVTVVRKRFKYMKKGHGQFKFDEYYKEETTSDNLVPGDVIEIDGMTMMQCDAVLLSGMAVTNERLVDKKSEKKTNRIILNFKTCSIIYNIQ